MVKPEARIENWEIGTIYEGSPEVLFGNVYGHSNPELFDGVNVHTSPIVNKDLRNNRVETKNTVYILGAPKAIDNKPQVS